MKGEKTMISLKDCQLCPRRCGVDRTQRAGFCRAGAKARIALVSLHKWEEPCLTGAAGRGAGAVFFAFAVACGILSKKVTPKAGEYTMIVGFLIGMVRLVTNVFTDTGRATMDGALWNATTWFWQTNWLVFECWLLVFLLVFIYAVSMVTPAPSKAQIDAITFTTDFKKSIKESWGVFDVVGTLVVIGLCACFYWYFW